MEQMRRSPLALAAALAALGLLFVLAAFTASARGPGADTDGDSAWAPVGGPVAPGGQVDALAVHPAISGTLYAAVAPMGSYDTGPSRLYRSFNGGALWVPVHESPNQIYSLATAGPYIYAGAFNADDNGPGILVSTDGGATWSVGQSFAQRGVWTDVAIDLANPQAAIAGGWLAQDGGPDKGQVIGTTDGGAIWTPLLNVAGTGGDASVTAVLVHPLLPGSMLAAARPGLADHTVIYRSSDGGATWPDTYTIPDAHVLSLAAHASNPQILYAGTGSSAFTWGPGQVYRSTDAGLTWTEVLSVSGGYLAFEPPSTVYAAGEDGLWASVEDGGLGTWSRVGDTDGPNALEIDLGPTPAALYQATWRGVSASTSGGAEWEARDEGIEALHRPDDLEVDPSRPQRLFAAVESASGGYRTDDGGATWTRVMAQHVNGFGVDPVDPEVVYAGVWACVQATIWRSHDGGTTWAPVYTPPYFEPDCSGGGQGIYEFAVAPSDPDTVFAAGAAYTTTTKPSDHSVILRSLNGGLSWTEVLSTAPGWEYKLAINPVDDAVVYAALNDDDAVHSGGRLRRSIDGGDTWQVILETQDDIGSIAIDPFDPGVIFAADAGRLRKSTDGGDTWSIACDPGTNPCGSLVVMDPNKPGHLYLGGHGYIGESDDGGVTWTGRDAPLNLGTPNSHPADLVTNHGTPIQTLYASFTGVWSHTRLSPTEGDRYVAPSGSDGDNRCTEANAPCRTVDRALEVANPGETIRVAAGTYSGMVSRQSPPGYNGPALISQHIYVDESVTIRGGYTADFGEPPDPAANPTTLDGGGQGRVVIIAGDASPTLEGLRIVNGDATGLGGSDEGWDAGGGIYILEAKAVLYNCSVGGSSAYAGGGLFFADSEATLARTIVRGNSADWGGGGLYLEGGAPVLVNNVIADNQAGDVGSGLHLDASSPLLLHNTVANNNGGEGSGVYVTDSSGSYSHAELVNTLIAGHSIGLHVTSGSTAVMDSTLWHGNTSNWTGSGSISPVKNYSGDPLFVDPGLGDYHIACGSAATNMGVNAEVDEDIDGLPRPIGSGYDIGADEARCLVYLPVVLREVP